MISLETDHERRAYEVERAIDPDYSLPGVVLMRDTSDRPEKTEIIPPLKYLIIYGGSVVGFCNVKTNYYTRERWFNGIRLDEDYRNQGLGIATYREAVIGALLRGLSFRTDRTVNANAKNRWERFAAIGVALAVREFQPTGRDCFEGHYVVDAESHLDEQTSRHV